MIPVMCVVQEGQISAEVEYVLKAEISAFALRAFDETADIDWIEVPKGNGFTAAEPSNTVVASLQSNRSLATSERVSLLKELSEICMDRTGRSFNEVVVAIRDAS